MAETLRLQVLDSPWLAPVVATGAWILARATVEAALQMGRSPRRALLAGGLWTLGVLLAWAALGARFPALLGLSLAVASLATLLALNVNAPRIRRVNLLSLACCVGVFAGLEWGVPFTETGRQWATAYSWSQGWERLDKVQSALADLDALDQARPTDYPDRGYPVAFPPRGDRPRLVAFGGSSTAGAWQNDDLRDFYPALLGDLLGPGVEVVNQGVGGWTSHHVRLYAEQQLARLDPDIVTVYLGNNDAAHGLPCTYAQLAARRGRSSTPSPLRRSILYRGLVTVLFEIRKDASVPAVTPAEMDANLRDLVDRARGLGARVLLLPEATRCITDVALRPYEEVLHRMGSEGPDVRFLDVAAPLERVGPGAFLDCNHLSPEGHGLLARMLAEELVRLGWVSGAVPPQASPGGAPTGP